MKLMTLYQRFRKAYSEMKNGGVGIDEEFVVISRKIWDNSQRRYANFLETVKAVRPN